MMQYFLTSVDFKMMLKYRRVKVRFLSLGTCVKDSRSLSEEAVAFVRSSPLADDAVHNYFGAPLSIHSGSDHFTQIAVDAQVTFFLYLFSAHI